MKVLFTPLAEVGHVNPLVGVAQRLVQTGHEVAFHCRRRFSAQLARAGVDAEWRGEVEIAPATVPEALAARMRNPTWLRAWYARSLAVTPAEVDAITATVHALRPDVVVVDPANAAAAIVAEAQSLPWIGVSTNFASLTPTGWSCSFLDVGSSLVPGLAQLAMKRGAPALRFSGPDAVSPFYNSVFTTEALVPRATTMNRHSSYIGPARALDARGDDVELAERHGTRPLVYVSSGGGQALSFEREHLLRIARALDAEPVDVIVSAPALHDDAAFRTALPVRCEVVPYAPQRRLLDRAALAITHGGVNSLNEALDRGVPTLVLPLGFEQPLQAELVQRTGVGLALDPFTMTDATCRGALHELLADDRYRRSARAIQASYRAVDSTAALCEALGRIVSGERIVPDLEAPRS